MKKLTDEQLECVIIIRELIGEDVDEYDALETYEEMME